MFQLLHMNVLDAAADAPLLTIDGQARSLRGNVAQSFQRRWPEAYEDLEGQLHFPIPLGTAVRIAADTDTDSPWQTILFVSTLHHLETLDDHDRHRVIRNGLLSALNIAARTGLRTLAATVMKGGWRLRTPEAYRTMSEAWRDSALQRLGGTLLVCCLDDEEYKVLLDAHRRPQEQR